MLSGEDREQLDIEANPPAGMLVHTAGFTGSGQFRIVDVWESEGNWAEFRDGRLAEALKPVFESGDFNPPSAEYTYELHDLITR